MWLWQMIIILIAYVFILLYGVFCHKETMGEIMKREDIFHYILRGGGRCFGVCGQD